MSSTELALIDFIFWFVALIVLIEALRTSIVLRTNRLANDFLPDGTDLSPFMRRLVRTHANCYESFPCVGAILLYAIATNKVNITDGLALWLLGARVLQSTIHLMSDNPTFSKLRFGFFVVQITIVVYWLFSFVSI